MKLNGRMTTRLGMMTTKNRCGTPTSKNNKATKTVLRQAQHQCLPGYKELKANKLKEFNGKLAQYMRAIDRLDYNLPR